MKITCTKCDKKLVIADEKLVGRDEFSVTCPQCSEKIIVNLKNSGAQNESESSSSDDFAEGARPALICESNPEIQGQFVKALKELGFSPIVPASVDETFEKIRFTRFEVVILNELFGGSTVEQNDLLEHFVKMPMIDRRHIFLALVGNGFTSMDNGASFSKSVNVVINQKDAQNFKSILKKSLADNEQFYRMYKTILKELGKA
jgi:DNA-directed RNA polymerase subunit RPC12/RpoP